MNRKKINYFTSIYLVLSISQYYGSFFASIFYKDFRDYKQILLDGYLMVNLKPFFDYTAF